MSRVRTRLEQYKAELERQSQYKAGLPGSALDIVNTLLKDLKEDESTVTDQKAIDAVNTIRRYCNCRYCGDCSIWKLCEEYFNKIDVYPEDWMELEIDTREKGTEE